MCAATTLGPSLHMGSDDDGLLLLHRPFTRGPSALVFSLGWQERSAEKLSAFSRVCVYIYYRQGGINFEIDRSVYATGAVTCDRLAAAFFSFLFFSTGIKKYFRF